MSHTVFTPEEFVRGLMRGDKHDFKSGYSPTNAALAVRDARELDEDAYQVLLAYAKGFGEGMQRILGQEPQVLHFDDPRLGVAWGRGVSDGAAEDASGIKPVNEP